MKIFQNETLVPQASCRYLKIFFRKICQTVLGKGKNYCVCEQALGK
jgi:hypothetical protein